MSARNGSRKSRPNRNQYIDGPGERRDAEVVDEGEPRPEILGVLHCCSDRTPAPMIVNAGEEPADRDDPRRQHRPARARRDRQREQRRCRRADDQDAVEQQACRDAPTPSGATVDNNAFGALRKDDRRARTRRSTVTVASATNGRKTSSGNQPGQISARMPRIPESRREKPEADRTAVAHERPRRRQVDDEKRRASPRRARKKRPHSSRRAAAATP